MTPSDPNVAWSVIDRPGDVGIDLPPGASAKELQATDYRPAEQEVADAGAIEAQHRCVADLLHLPHPA